jgi:predicted ATPase
VTKETIPVTSDTQRLFVVTAGPGSGKTTLIDALAQAGCARSIEAGRGVIQDQVAIGGPALPWRDPQAFAELMLCWEMRSYHLAQEQAGPVFFDRGVPDVIGYLRMLALPVPHHMEEAAATFRYHGRVFIAPPWPDIFRQDSERKQSLEEAVRTYESMVDVYGAYGYELVELPRSSVEQRVRFVLETAEIAGTAR